MSEQNGPLPFTLETVKAQVRFYQAGPVREMYKKQAETMKSFLLQNETAMTISVMEGDAKEKFLQDMNHQIHFHKFQQQQILVHCFQ